MSNSLSAGTRTARVEDQAYDAAVRWLKDDVPNRQPLMADKCQILLISKNFLCKTVQAELLFQDNQECLKLVVHLLSPEDGEELAGGAWPCLVNSDNLYTAQFSSCLEVIPLPVLTTGPRFSLCLIKKAKDSLFTCIIFIHGTFNQSVIVR